MSSTIAQTFAPVNGDTKVWRSNTYAPPLPEAPASVNVYVETPVGRIQATARSHNEVEAVASLAILVDAIKARFAPRPVCPDCGKGVDHDRRDLPRCTQCALAAERQLTKEQQLGLLLAKGIACAVSKGDASLVDRLGKAAALVMAGAIEPTERAQALAVRSQSDDTLYYTVEDGKHCSCPYAANHPERSCKHKLAVHLWQRLGE